MVKRDSYFELQHDKTMKMLFFILFGAVIGGLVFIFRYFFWPFLFALLLYMALQPLYNIILSRVKKDGLSSAIMILFLVLLVMVPLFFIVVAVIDQVFQLYDVVQRQIKAGVIDDIYSSRVVQDILAYLNIDKSDITTKATDFVQNISGMVLSSVQAMIAYPLGLLIDFFFLLLILFFMFKEGSAMRALFYRNMPFPPDLEEKVIGRMKEVIRVLLTGNLLIMICQGLLVGIGLFIVGIPLAFLGGSLAAILSLIPVIGTSLVWVPAVIYLLATGSYLMALFLGIWCLAWYLLLENVVKPKVFGKKLNFHPIIFFFLLLGSIQAFGLPGVFVGPLLLTLFYSLWEIYKMLDAYGMNGHDPGRKGKKGVRT
ncbi:MAG TPA: AI-2E family transporter [Spirochaetota bacterium]|nr:AI-2E family transporter [Spirochaetota bacterium]HPC40007.1 AI-2E family transporter [Spirochaetota bacterium]HPL16612.1 AI-2E family transporter [Spirochaetota bacterium]HQF09824.1 AI-2E family transporter [Spirochaetota bacterium]HQH98752.1 AI-2E family transporter [Spirochaetota bacterium]